MANERGNPTLGWTAAVVLQAIARGHRWGFDVMGATRLPSGTVYPLLRRLEGAGLVTSGWEDEEAAHARGRPARRYYEPTGAGLAALAAARERLAAQRAVFGDALSDAGGG